MNNSFTGINLPEEFLDSNEVKQTGTTESKTAEQIPLFNFPKTPPDLKPFSGRSERQKGVASESLVLSDLQVSGFDAFKTDGLLPWDLGLDIAGRIIKIQVKGTSSASEKLVFEFVRNSRHPHGPRKVPYERNAYHIAACASLIHRQVIYQPGVERRIYLKSEQFSRQGSAFASLLMSLKAIGIPEGEIR